MRHIRVRSFLAMLAFVALLVGCKASESTIKTARNDNAYHLTVYRRMLVAAEADTPFLLAKVSKATTAEKKAKALAKAKKRHKILVKDAIKLCEDAESNYAVVLGETPSAKP